MSNSCHRRAASCGLSLKVSSFMPAPTNLYRCSCRYCDSLWMTNLVSSPGNSSFEIGARLLRALSAGVEAPDTSESELVAEVLSLNVVTLKSME